MRLTAMVVFILLGARVFSLVFQGVGGGHWIEGMLTALPGGVVGFLIFVNIFIFIIAFFLDFFEIAFIIIPLLAPAANTLGIDLIWFGVLICANMQTSFMHPPFGFALFYLRGIAPREQVKTSDIYWGAIPWVDPAVDHGGDPDRLPGAGHRLPRHGQRRGHHKIRSFRADPAAAGGELGTPPAFDLNAAAQIQLTARQAMRCLPAAAAVGYSAVAEKDVAGSVVRSLPLSRKPVRRLSSDVTRGRTAMAPCRAAGGSMAVSRSTPSFQPRCMGNPVRNAMTGQDHETQPPQSVHGRRRGARRLLHALLRLRACRHARQAGLRRSCAATTASPSI